MVIFIIDGVDHLSHHVMLAVKRPGTQDPSQDSTVGFKLSPQCRPRLGTVQKDFLLPKEISKHNEFIQEENLKADWRKRGSRARQR